jgi:Mn-dependent DtxR family transcriptional regulator
MVRLGASARADPTSPAGLAHAQVVGEARIVGLWPQELEVLWAAALRPMSAETIASALRADSGAVERILADLIVAGYIEDQLASGGLTATPAGTALVQRFREHTQAGERLLVWFAGRPTARRRASGRPHTP